MRLSQLSVGDKFALMGAEYILERVGAGSCRVRPVLRVERTIETRGEVHTFTAPARATEWAPGTIVSVSKKGRRMK